MTKVNQNGIRNTADSRNLRSLFPMYRNRQEIEEEIRQDPKMRSTFSSWDEEQQEEFLDFCCGNRGVKILYDSFFKYVFDPDSGKTGLMRLISVLLDEEITDISILPNESRLGADYSLVIMDIIVETADGSIVNIEVQKIGYRFPGERAACYNAHLLLREYQRVRREAAGQADSTGVQKKTLFYNNIHPVYTIVLIERSTQEFHRFGNQYFHKFAPKSDTGLELKLLQNYIFIPLDIFRAELQNKGIETERDAWLAFLSCDDPKMIQEILRRYPEVFRDLYRRICDLCRNTGEVMSMYSSELAEMDRNTTMLMIEELQDEINRQKEDRRKMENKLEQKDKENKELRRKLADAEAALKSRT